MPSYGGACGRRASSPEGRRPAPRPSRARAPGGARGARSAVSRPIASASSAGDHAAGEDQVERAAEARRCAAAAGCRRRSAALPSGARGSRSVEPSAATLQVAPQRQLEPAREAPAGDRGDRGLRRCPAREAERAARPRPAVGRASSIAFRSAARAEGELTGAGEDHHARRVVGLEALEPLARAGRPSDRRPRCGAPARSIVSTAAAPRRS